MYVFERVAISASAVFCSCSHCCFRCSLVHSGCDWASSSKWIWASRITSVRARSPWPRRTAFTAESDTYIDSASRRRRAASIRAWSLAASPSASSRSAPESSDLSELARVVSPVSAERASKLDRTLSIRRWTSASISADVMRFSPAPSSTPRIWV